MIDRKREASTSLRPIDVKLKFQRKSLDQVYRINTFWLLLLI